MVHHVLTLGILMIVQGVLEVLLGMLLLAYSAMMPQVIEAMKEMDKNFSDKAFAQIEEYLPLIMMVLGILTLIGGVFHVVGGVRTLRFRNRALGIVSLVLGSCSMASFYCAPTNIALLVYGLIVY